MASTVTFVFVPAVTPESTTVTAPFESTDKGPPVGIETAPTALAVALGRSEAASVAVPVICPKLLKVTFVAVAPVVVAAIDKAPAPVTDNPPALAIETAPTAEVVARGKSPATKAAVAVIKPCALYVIPERVAAETILFIPRFPEATFKDLSILLVFNLAAVTVPSVNFVPLIPVATFASVTAPAAIFAVVTEVAPKAVVSTAPAAILALVTASSIIFAVVTASSAIEVAANVPESLAAVTAPSAIFAVVIAASATAAVSTASSASSVAVTALVAIFAEVTAFAAIAAVSTALSASSEAVTAFAAI